MVKTKDFYFSRLNGDSRKVCACLNPRTYKCDLHLEKESLQK